MRKIFSILLFIITLTAFSQDPAITTQGAKNRAFQYLGGVKVDRAFVLPSGTHDALYPDLDLRGRTQINDDTDLMEYHDGTQWVRGSFTPTQYDAILTLIYRNNTSTLTVSPTFGERGISTAVSVNYQITTNDDVFTSASINQGIGAATWNDGSHTVSGGNRSQTTTYTLTKNYTRNNVGSTDTQSATYTTYVPQWSGVSTSADFTDNYSTINGQAGFVKAVQASTISISRSFTTTGSNYPYFITNVATGVIKDTNGFSYSISNVTDFSNLSGVTGYWVRHPLTLTLNDGTTATLYIIRTRELTTLTAFTFVHSNN